MGLEMELFGFINALVFHVDTYFQLGNLVDEKKVQLYVLHFN